MGEKPATKGRRLVKLASMTAKVAGRYAGARIKSAFQSAEDAARDRARMHAANGARIAQTLGELKGAVMKVGQMASIARDIVPPELAEALTSLQREAPPMPFEVIEEQIESEFGAPPSRLFQTFDRVPFAAASIGQVHRAVTDDGREVVVKAQYPGVDGAVDSDLRQLKLALVAGGLVRVPREALDAVFREVRDRMVEELDYTLEAQAVRTFRTMLDDRTDVVIPQVVGERSAKRVLTLTYEPGDRLDRLDDALYTQTIRNQIGSTLFDLIAEQLFVHQTIHADPNPANFAFRPDGTVVLYDFGCIKRLESDTVTNYRRAIRCALAEDYAGLDQALTAIGARNPSGTPVPPDVYRNWRNLFAQPFLADTPFEFGASDLHRDALKLMPEFLAKYMTSFKPPAELVFVDRVVAGHYHNLRLLRANIALGPQLRRYLDPSDP